MNKTLRKIIVGAACCATILPVAVPLAACGQANDPETRAVSLALGAVDQNFNPFFFTQQNDGEVVSLTQIPLITANRNAEVACGDNEATVALAYKEVMYDANGNVTAEGDENGRTEYEFVIKNGIKFSDGVDLTIKDVLFNLYVYLDPMYTGSSTIYATKIKGLAAYRAQNPTMSEDEADNYTSKFLGQVNGRFSTLLNYDTAPYTSPKPTDDLLLVAEEFESELNSDWTSNVGTVKSYEENYRFTEDWEVFYFNEGLIDYQRDANGVRKKDDNNKYITTLDAGATNDQTHLRTNMNAALSEDKVSAYASANSCSNEEAREKLMQKEAVQTLFDEYLKAEKNENGKFTSADRRSNGSLYRLLTQWNTGTAVRTRILNKIMSDAYSSSTELAVKSISGITTYNTAEKPFSGATAGSPLKSGENYDVLKIVISGVDPAAKWNFGFTVAPMHYYSNEEMTKIAMETPSNADVSNRFGVKFSNDEFFNTVLKASSKTAKPVGAGAYKSLNNLIYNNKEANYERNEYFHTVGADLENAKIKYLKYKTVSDAQLVNTLATNGIDFGMPNCSKDNIAELTGKGHLTQIPYDANGFGYVGINPKYVPELGVRQAIMKSMNINSITKDYYGSDYAAVIYRPISKTSWAYPKNSSATDEHYSKVAYTTDLDEIDRLVRSSGYTKNGDIYVSNRTGQPLKLTFTIAGESTDHPAYQMFLAAAKKLNEIGFDITVQYDIQALAKLATAKLAVWAAAWSTGIDPDMYQVYHKDSKASSVKNWGYDVILNDTQNIYNTEKSIIEALSKDIIDARSTNNRDRRAEIYESAYNKVMDLAVELPTYQRKDIAVYNNKILDGKTLNTKANANEGVLSRIWELNYV